MLRRIRKTLNYWDQRLGAVLGGLFCFAGCAFLAIPLNALAWQFSSMPSSADSKSLFRLMPLAGIAFAMGWVGLGESFSHHALRTARQRILVGTSGVLIVLGSIPVHIVFLNPHFLGKASVGLVCGGSLLATLGYGTLLGYLFFRFRPLDAGIFKYGKWHPSRVTETVASLAGIVAGSAYTCAIFINIIPNLPLTVPRALGLLAGSGLFVTGLALIAYASEPVRLALIRTSRIVAALPRMRLRRLGPMIGPPARAHLSLRGSDFDVFLCHNGRDKEEVRRIGMALRDRGLRPWLDEWELRPGMSWQEALENQIGLIPAAAVFIGGAGMSPWASMELRAFLNELASRGCTVIPVLLPDAPQYPDVPLFLRGMTWVDFRNPDSDPLQRLVWGITGQKGVTV